MALCERSSDLRQLDELLADAREGHGRVALVSAVAGAGKTALLHEFWKTLADTDVLMLSATCVPSERHLPFGMLTQLFESPALTGEDASRAMRLLDDPTPATQDRPSDDALAARGFTRLVLEMSERQPVVLCVDDVHNADHESLDHLLRLVRRLHSAPVLAVLTERIRPVKVHSLLHTELLRQPHVTSIRPGLLSPHGVQEMIAEAAGTAAGARMAADYYATTGGNPLLVQALLQDLRDPAQPAAEDGAAPGLAFSHAVLGCLHSAGTSPVRVAQGIALLSESATPALLSLLLELPRETVTRTVAELTAIGLVRDGRLRCGATAQVILGDLAPDVRERHHRRAARLLRDAGESPRTVARHLLQANTAAESWMVDTLIDAAGTLLDDDARHAKAYLELARRFSTTDPRRQSGIAAALARIELRLCPSGVLRLLPQLSTAISDGHIAQQLALELPEILLWYSRIDENERLYRHLEQLVDTDDPRVAVELGVCRMLLAAVFPQLAERIPDALHHVSGVELAGTAFTANTRLNTFAHLRTVLCEGPSVGAVHSAQQALAATRLGGSTAALLAAAVTILIRADQPRLAEKWADRLLKEATDRGAANWQGTMADQRAHVALRAGDLPGAERYARLALHRMPPQAWGVAVGGVYATLLRAYNEMGRHAQATELLCKPVPEALFDSTFGLEYLYAKACHYLATQQQQAALSDFRACGELMAQWGLDQSTLVPWSCGAAQALLMLGRRDAARRLAEEQLAQLTPGHSPQVRGMTLRILAATRSPRQRVELLAEAVDVLQRSGDQLELAKALTDLGEVHQRLGDSALAQITARRGLLMATECQARPLVGRARRAIEGARESTFADGHHPVPGAGEVAEDCPTVAAGTEPADKLAYLTEAERRVCVLAGRGRTNREIAGELFITVSTVEQHLTRVYRKLRVKRRQDLHQELASGRYVVEEAQPPSQEARTLAACAPRR
ncbi:AAA family ATPase [Streptomyces inhibens]|uniref:AAA family ATPase n=1 Tax=Streptomyces inhibens TaxID=2293571 RepID=UPI00402ADE3D